MSILIVDDSLVSRTFMADLLTEVGYAELIVCGSMEEAYRAIGFHDPQRTETDLDLALLDINLPGKSGIAACREMAGHSVFCDVPVIVISGTDHLEGLEAAFSAGAVDYIMKPPSHTELLARVRSALRLKREMTRRRAREIDLLVLNERLAEANRELERLSTTDALTGLANRRAFNQGLHREWLRAQREKQPLAVLMIDIDHFKRFNDRYGHLEGDVCLQQVAWALQAALGRGGDLLARYGGEEFVAILPRTEARGAAEVAAELHRRVDALALPHAASPVTPTVTISIGTASCVPSRGSDAAQLVALADEALYQAKQAGRNRTVAASPP